jgi:hypothetical protein
MRAYDIFKSLEYVDLEDLQDVKYIDEEPHITMCMNALRPKYHMLNAMAFPNRSVTVPILTQLGDMLQKEGITIVSEVLPVPDSNNFFYTITYHGKDKNFIRSLEIIADTCNQYLLAVKNLDVSINGDNNRFTVVCTLSYCDTAVPAIVLGNDKDKIPAAFGYKEQRPRIVSKPIETPKPALPIVGSIKDWNGHTIFYRSTGKGKIQVRGES